MILKAVFNKEKGVIKMEQGRFIVIVLDSYGVGYMDDVLEVRPRDFGANTCKHIIDKIPELKLENLEKMGKKSVENLLISCFSPAYP